MKKTMCLLLAVVMVIGLVGCGSSGSSGASGSSASGGSSGSGGASGSGDGATTGQETTILFIMLGVMVVAVGAIVLLRKKNRS